MGKFRDDLMVRYGGVTPPLGASRPRIQPMTPWEIDVTRSSFDRYSQMGLSTARSGVKRPVVSPGMSYQTGIAQYHNKSALRDSYLRHQIYEIDNEGTDPYNSHF